MKADRYIVFKLLYVTRAVLTIDIALKVLRKKRKKNTFERNDLN